MFTLVGTVLCALVWKLQVPKLVKLVNGCRLAEETELLGGVCKGRNLPRWCRLERLFAIDPWI